MRGSGRLRSLLSKRTVFPWSMSDFKPGEKVCAVGTHLAKAARNAAAPRVRDTKAEKRPNALAVRGTTVPADLAS